MMPEAPPEVRVWDLPARLVHRAIVVLFVNGILAGKRPIDDKMKQRLDRVTKEEEEWLLHFYASQQ